MARFVDLTSSRTYATRENAIKVVEKFMNKAAERGVLFENQQYFVTCGSDGRWFPVFVGERAIQAMLHFHFTVVA